MKANAGTLIATTLFLSALPLSAKSDSTPRPGLVPDEATAIAIARAVLIPIYGAKQIRSEEPLTARRNGDIWVVTGTLCPNYKAPEGLPQFCVGGTAELKLSVKDGRVLHVTHYQ